MATTKHPYPMVKVSFDKYDRIFNLAIKKFKALGSFNYEELAYNETYPERELPRWLRGE